MRLVKIFMFVSDTMQILLVVWLRLVIMRLVWVLVSTLSGARGLGFIRFTFEVVGCGVEQFYIWI